MRGEFREFGIKDVIDLWYNSEDADADNDEIIELEGIRGMGFDRVRWVGDVRFGDGGWIAERSDWNEGEKYGQSYFKVGYRTEEMLNEIGEMVE